MNHQPQAGRNVNHAPSFGCNLVLVSNCQLLLQAFIGFQLGLRRGMPSMRAPNHEEQTMVQPEPQREAQWVKVEELQLLVSNLQFLNLLSQFQRGLNQGMLDLRAPNHENHCVVQMQGLHHLLKANVGCMVKNIGMRKGFQEQGQQGQQAQPQRHASQAREPRNAPWPQGDVVEPWYDHGGGKGNWGRARNYQGPQDRDPYGKNQDPLQRQQGRQAREPRAMKLEFPRFKGGDPTS
uniref:Uncharacterized protein n=1 Tax=Fagus sylvatica TaxID=28930 RepID=A0A2N9GAS2_FAGSY